jgi:polar amino acid transport system substrate-binding protein
MAHRFVALLALVFALAVPALARADQLADVRSRGELQWCGDQEGGGPYVFPKEDDPSLVTGFEVDLAAKLAQYLKVKPRFMQGPWDKLGDLVKTKKCDVVLNGYEFTPERNEALEPTIPYYVYGLQLLVRKGGAVKTWGELTSNPGGTKAKIGVLTGSAAATKMEEYCGESNALCEVASYDGGTDTMREVETGKLDATLHDTPTASFYAPRFPGLQPSGAPVGKGYYVMYVAKGESALRDALNEAIVLMTRNGELEATYRTYGIWDGAQSELGSISEMSRFFGLDKAVRADVKKQEMPSAEVVHTEARKHGLAVFKAYGGIMLESAGLTIVLAFMSFPLAILIGLGIAVGRLFGPRWLRIPLTAYVEFLRGTPLMLQLYFLFFLLPEVGITIPAFWTGILGLAINYSAYESEIYRAGLQAIPPGQLEAALSLGMSRAQAIRRIVVPQAVRIVIPPVVNDFIALFKDTSVVSVVTLVELTKRFSVLSMSTQATIELMAMTAGLYLMMSYPMSVVAQRIEQRLGVSA